MEKELQEELVKALDLLESAQGRMDGEGFLEESTYANSITLDDAKDIFQMIDQAYGILAKLVE
jgi:hypothetical protein